MTDSTNPLQALIDHLREGQRQLHALLTEGGAGPYTTGATGALGAGLHDSVEATVDYVRSLIPTPDQLAMLFPTAEPTAAWWPWPVASTPSPWPSTPGTAGPAARSSPDRSPTRYGATSRATPRAGDSGRAGPSIFEPTEPIRPAAPQMLASALGTPRDHQPGDLSSPAPAASRATPSDETRTPAPRRRLADEAPDIGAPADQSRRELRSEPTLDDHSGPDDDPQPIWRGAASQASSFAWSPDDDPTPFRPPFDLGDIDWSSATASALDRLANGDRP